MTEDYVAAAVQAAVALADTNYREGAERIRAFLDSLTAEERDYERWQLAGALLQLGDDSRSDHLLNDLRGSDEKRRFRAAVAASTRLRKQWYDPHPREWWGEAGKLIPSPQTAVTAFKDCADCPEMVVLPGRTFLMGSAETEAERHDSEGPQHKVTLKPFAIGKYEVTFAEWDACVKDGGCNGYRPADNGWGRGRRPVINVSWFDAQAYVEWLAKATRKPYRLPSEAEWEYAARAGTTTRFSVGDDITPKAANYSESKLGKTTEVGVYPKNPWGLYDMHGNVWELVEDIWHNNYEGAPADGSAWTDGEEKTSRRSRVNRGGSWVAFPSWFVPWLNSPRFLRSAFRGSYAPGIRIDDCGFRVARTLDSGQADSFSSSRDRSTATPLRLEPVR